MQTGRVAVDVVDPGGCGGDQPQRRDSQDSVVDLVRELADDCGGLVPCRSQLIRCQWLLAAEVLHIQTCNNQTVDLGGVDRLGDRDRRAAQMGSLRSGMCCCPECMSRSSKPACGTG